MTITESELYKLNNWENGPLPGPVYVLHRGQVHWTDSGPMLSGWISEGAQIIDPTSNSDRDVSQTSAYFS